LVPRLFFKMMEGIAMALTTIGITNLRPKKADYRVADGGGLYILVRPNGSKLWRYDYRLEGCQRTHSIGEWGEGSNRRRRDPWTLQTSTSSTRKSLFESGDRRD
jgi:hypothetical protein